MKKGRGSFDCSMNYDIVMWADNSCVTLASTASGIEPVGKILRYDKIEKEKMQAHCP